MIKKTKKRIIKKIFYEKLKKIYKIMKNLQNKQKKLDLLIENNLKIFKIFIKF